MQRGDMAEMFDDKTKQEVWQTLQDMNRVWTTGRCEELKDYFHERMIAIVPSARLRLEGRQACIDGWASFVKATTKIHYWKEIDPQIQVYGDCAVVTYYYEMSVEMGGQTANLVGRDMLLFVKENGKWWVVADQFSPYPK